MKVLPVIKLDVHGMERCQVTGRYEEGLDDALIDAAHTLYMAVGTKESEMGETRKSQQKCGKILDTSRL